MRDGLAFVFAWNAGVIIYDVGNGMCGRLAASPVEVSRLVTARDGSPARRCTTAGGSTTRSRARQRYLFIGQEGPGLIGSRSSGDIHVVDVSDLRASAGGRDSST